MRGQAPRDWSTGWVAQMEERMMLIGGELSGGGDVDVVIDGKTPFGMTKWRCPNKAARTQNITSEYGRWMDVNKKGP